MHFRYSYSCFTLFSTSSNGCRKHGCLSHSLYIVLRYTYSPSLFFLFKGSLYARNWITIYKYHREKEDITRLLDSQTRWTVVIHHCQKNAKELTKWENPHFSTQKIIQLSLEHTVMDLSNLNIIFSHMLHLNRTTTLQPMIEDEFFLSWMLMQ